MIPARTPPLTCGTITVRTISQRVAPSPIDASLTSCGTLRKSSRQTEEMIGSAIIVRTTIAMSIPLCDGVPPKIGIQPK